jgi:hypothetical protein
LESESSNDDYLLEEFEAASHPTTALLALSSYFLARGERDYGDEAYIRYRRAERSTLLQGIWTSFQYWTTGFGRQPIRAASWVGFFIVLGIIVFLDQGAMVYIGKFPEVRKYSPFWFTVGSFLPLIQLGGSDEWRPNPFVYDDEIGSVRNWLAVGRLYYWYAHSLLGWIFVPLLVAAVSGRIQIGGQ